MLYLRNAHQITRFMLVWFALYLSVAIASPFVNPKLAASHCAAMEALEKVTAHQNGDAQKSILKLDCPLCTGITAPPPTVILAMASVQLETCAPLGIDVSSIPRRPLAQTLARGPPAALPETFTF